MKKKKVFITIFVVSAVTAAISFWHWDKTESIYSHSELDEIRDEIHRNNPYHITSQPIDYKRETLKEYKREINFPVKRVSYAKLYSTRALSLSYKLSNSQMTALLEILNDSASYEWGELGTPQVDYYFTFYTIEDKTIGLTTIDLKGMAYSYPSLARMKWGSMKCMNEITELINEIRHTSFWGAP